MNDLEGFENFLSRRVEAVDGNQSLGFSDSGGLDDLLIRKPCSYLEPAERILVVDIIGLLRRRKRA
jgi:hypothetical protein